MKKPDYIILPLLALLIVFVLCALPFIANAQVLPVPRGGTGTGTMPSAGQVLVGQGNGTYAPRATSTLGILADFSAGYPLQYANSVLSLAFGTSTSNAWGGVQSFGEVSAASATSSHLAVTGSIDLLGTLITDLASWFGGQFDARLAAKDTDDLAEGSNLYFTLARVASALAGTTTDALAEGAANRYFTDDRADARITAQKGVADGLATLDGAGKVPITQLPSSIMEYQGTWNASTNSPTLADGTGATGDVYRVSVAGTRNLGSGAIAFQVGDYAIYNGATWEKSDTTDAVSTVNGLSGDVTLTTSEIGEGANLYFTSGRVGSYLTSSSTLPAFLNYWGSDGTNAYRESGAVGVGTSTPRATLSVNRNSTSFVPLTIGGATPSVLHVVDNTNQVSGVQMANTSTGTNADFRLLLTDTSGHYFAFAQPGANNTVAAVLGQPRASTDYLFNSGGTARNLTIGTLDAKDLIFGTNNAESMRILSGGNVGIGTSTPAYRLDVAGVAAEMLAIERATGQTGRYVFTVSNAQGGVTGSLNINNLSAGARDITLRGATSGNAQFILKGGTGNLGVGTTSPWANLSVVNSASGPGFVVGGGTGGITPQLIVDTSGNVGIGTTTPDSQLTVVGQAKFGAAGSAVRINSTAATAVVESNSNSDFLLSVNNATSDFGIRMNSAVRFTVRNSGSVGIGTTTPYSRFHVTTGSSATTTSTFGAPGDATSRACFNTKNTAGADISFYFVGTSMVVETNLCR